MGTSIADTHVQSETPDVINKVTGETIVDEPSPPPSPPPSGGGGIMPSNEPPVAEAGPNRTVYVNVAIHFNGAESYDPDGTIVEYHWFPGDGSYKSGIKVMHIYEEAGNYTASLSITDNYGATGSDNCMVTVHPMPAEPKTMASKMVAANQTGYVVDALDDDNTTVTVNTTDTVTITVIKYESNPHPEDPMPAAGIPKYADIYISDPDAVEWPIYVEMFYTDEEVEGLDEESLGIYYWKPDAWHRCSYTGVNTYTNIVWAYMTAEEASGSPILIAGMHAIPTPPLPPILSNLNVTPAVIELGGNVTISFDIMNIDSQSITYIVTMQIGYLTLLVDVELEAYEATTVSRTITPYEVGAFSVTVDGMTGSFTVISAEPPLRPAEFVFSELEALGRQALIHDDEERPIVEGEYVIFSVLVINIGETEGTYIVEFKVDGETIDTYNWTLAAGRGHRAIAYYEALNAGTYQLSVGNLTEIFIVRAPLEPAELVFSNLVIVPGDWISIDETWHWFTISVDVTNVGEEMGGCTVELKVDGEVVDSVDIAAFGGIPPDYDQVTATQFFNLTRSEGIYEVEVEGLTGSFTVVKPKPLFWESPINMAVIIVIIITAAAILYAYWKGKLPSLSTEKETKKSAQAREEEK